MPSKHESTQSEGALASVTHVFLDVGGTLLYPKVSPADIFRRALATRGVHVDRESIVRFLRSPEMIVNVIRPIADSRVSEFYRSVNARVIEHLGFESDEAMLDEIHAQFNSPVWWRPFPDAPEALKSLRGAGFRLGVISNASHDLPDTLRKAGLGAYLETITYSFDVGAEKPHPKIFRAAVAQAGTTPERAVHVGDSFDADYLGARSVGLHALLLCREGNPPGPCPAIRSLMDLPRVLGVGRSRK
ncbi:MAG TPA: HAD-IA family hydrolase [Thermoplasmata archaeon]|jgi:putative hydrolase of the HAD superfamily